MIANLLNRNGHGQPASALGTLERTVQPSLTSEVRCTTDYDLFHFDPRNRPLIPKKIRDLTAAIKRKNLLREFPIVVDLEMRVTDGQHRLTVAKNLGLPVWYIVSTDMKLEDVPQASKGVTRWTYSEYLHFYCESGREEYRRLRDFCDTYPFIGLSQAISLCHMGTENSDFYSGEYTVNDMPFAISVAEAVLEFAEYFDRAKSRTFIAAVNNLMSNRQYDQRRMIQKLKYQAGHLQRLGDAKSYIDALNTIYNRGVRADNRVLLQFIHPADSRHRACAAFR